MAKTSIEWTDFSWNPIRARREDKVGWLCEHVSDGCKLCYSERLNKRLGTGLPFKPGHRKDVEMFLDEKTMMQPLHWRRPRKIFVCSMSDLFGPWVTDEWLDRVFAVMALAPQHTFICLTKRPARMRDYAWGRDRPTRVWCAASEVMDTLWALMAHGASWGGERPWPLKNVWKCVSAEDQPTADERIPLLLDTLAAVRGVSLEPLLGPIDLSPYLLRGKHNGLRDQVSGGVEDRSRGPLGSLGWCIVGGESGPHARPMNPAWARSLQRQCQDAGVAFFYKQSGEWASVSEVEGAGAHFSFPDGQMVRRVGKKAAGRMLDGREHNEWPEIRA